MLTFSPKIVFLCADDAPGVGVPQAGDSDDPRVCAAESMKVALAPQARCHSLPRKHQGPEARLLGRKTVDYMLSDQLGPNIKNLVGNADPTRADYGFGLGLAVRTTPGVVRMMGSVGQFSWPGASGTDWWVDPKEELAVVYLSAAPGPIRWHYCQKINAMLYQAIIE
jgi:CubicO group peptidase (beta-lactamase class C family)